jgi:hypothetical protein
MTEPTKVTSVPAEFVRVTITRLVSTCECEARISTDNQELVRQCQSGKPITAKCPKCGAIVSVYRPLMITRSGR